MIFNLRGQMSKLPVLDSSYPADATVAYDYGNVTRAEFKVQIQEDGIPSDYSYQWYCGGEAVETDSDTYKVTSLGAEKSSEVYCVVSNRAGSVTSRKAKLEVTCNDYVLVDVSPKVEVSGNGFSQQAEYLQLKATLNVPCDLQTEMIDLTAFETLTGVFDYWSSPSNGFFWRIYDSSGNIVKSANIGFGEQDTYTNETHSIDVSDMSGNHYIYFQRDATSSGAYLGIRNLKLVS